MVGHTEVKLLLQGAFVVGAAAGAEDRPNEAAAVARTDVVVLQVVDRIAADEEVVGSDEEAVGRHVGDRVHQAGAYPHEEEVGQQRTEGEASYEVVVVDVVPDVEGAEDDGKGVLGMLVVEHQEEEGEGGVHKLPAAVVDHQDHQQWSKAASRVVVAVLHEKQQS